MTRAVQQVEVGQIWLDNDKRHLECGPQREIQILEVKGGSAKCVNLANKRISCISVARFKPNATGYRLKVSE